MIVQLVFKIIAKIIIKIITKIILKIPGAVSVCDSPAGHRLDDLCNRPRLCGKMLSHYHIVVKCFQMIIMMLMIIIPSLAICVICHLVLPHCGKPLSNYHHDDDDEVYDELDDVDDVDIDVDNDDDNNYANFEHRDEYLIT